MRTVTSKARQFGISLTQRGFTSTFYWSAFGYLKPNRFALLARDLSVDDICVPPRASARFECWTAGMMRSWRHQRQGLSTEFFQDTIDGVDTCAVALVEGTLAGMIWIYRPEQTSRLFRLEAHEAELNQGYILPAFRGMGLFTDMLTFACRFLQEQGYRTVYAGVHSGNGPSLRAFRHAGFCDIGWIRHFLVFRPKVCGHPLQCKST